MAGTIIPSSTPHASGVSSDVLTNGEGDRFFDTSVLLAGTSDLL